MNDLTVVSELAEIGLELKREDLGRLSTFSNDRVDEFAATLCKYEESRGDYQYILGQFVLYYRQRAAGSSDTRYMTKEQQVTYSKLCSEKLSAFTPDARNKAAQVVETLSEGQYKQLGSPAKARQIAAKHFPAERIQEVLTSPDNFSTRRLVDITKQTKNARAFLDDKPSKAAKAKAEVASLKQETDIQSMLITTLMLNVFEAAAGTLLTPIAVSRQRQSLRSYN